MRSSVISALVCAWFVLSPVADATELTGVRAEAAPGETRLVFDLSGAAQKHVFLIPDPDRIVVDLSGTQAVREPKLPPAAAGVIRQMRYSQQGDGIRLILDLGRRVKARNEMLDPDAGGGNRLVLTLAYADAPPANPVLVQTPPAPKPAPVAPAPVAVAAPVAADTKPAAPDPVPASPARRDDAKARPVLIAIDAGHGGDDVGAIGASGTYEKDITLLVARELKRMIDEQPGMKAVLTRDDDYYVGLRERMDKAREAKADLFVSIHADAFRDRRVQGSSVFVLSQRGATSEAARWLADRENAADLVGGVSLDDKNHVLKSVLLDLSQTASLEASLQVANDVLHSLSRIGAIHHTQVQQAGFVVLKSPDIPSLLVETAFITNPREEQRLRNDKFRRELATAVRDGIVSYFNESPPSGTQFAQNR
jgi:N-acetylmuramoyl-L-alanine amidase